MSAGKFEAGKYKADDGKVFPCKVQPETKALTIASTANAYPTEAVTSGLPSIKISANKREFGVIPRNVTVVITEDGTGKTVEYDDGSTYTIPVFDKAVFDGYTKGATGTYNGIACRVTGKSNEIIN